MTISIYCESRVGGRPKERFESEQQARRAVHHKRRFRGRRFPTVYHCPGCHGFHLTSGRPS